MKPPEHKPRLKGNRILCVSTDCGTDIALKYRMGYGWVVMFDEGWYFNEATQAWSLSKRASRRIREGRPPVGHPTRDVFLSRRRSGIKYMKTVEILPTRAVCPGCGRHLKVDTELGAVAALPDPLWADPEPQGGSFDYYPRRSTP